MSLALNRMMKMKEKLRWIILVIGLAFLYGIAYFIFINISTGKPIFGVIPEVLAYIVPIYFITSILIEVLINDIPNNNMKLILGKSLILLLYFLAFTVVYWIFYKYIIIANELKKSFIGKNAHFIFIWLMIFFGIKFSNKLYSK